MKAEIFNYQEWLNTTETKKLTSLMQNILQQAGFSILNYIDHNYSPYGYTGVWLLAESHLAIHTFPEENKTYIELSSCSKEKYNNFKKLLTTYLSKMPVNRNFC